jgi:Spy/CpxP family protein refolding chaperone
MNARKMGRRWLVMMMAMVVVMAGIGVAVAWAQQAPSPAGPCARPGGILTQDDRDAIGRIILQRTKEKLGLSDQQAEQIRTTLQSRRDDARADFQALCQARVDLRQLLVQQNSDPGALKDAADRVKLLQGKLLDRRLDTVVALRSQLSADQWAKWIELRKARARRWMGRAPAMGS